jgi:hypothetical protein
MTAAPANSRPAPPPLVITRSLPPQALDAEQHAHPVFGMGGPSRRRPPPGDEAAA